MASLFELLGTVNWDDLEGYKTRESGMLEYSNSKIMTIMAGREMNKRLKVISLVHLTCSPFFRSPVPLAEAFPLPAFPYMTE